MSEDKFASRIDNVKQEKIGKRPSEYSEWHRTLGPEYLTADIDFVESAEGKWIWAKITAMGIDAINNKEGKKKILKFLGVKIPIHIENKIAFINFNF